jgi:hypothetical protein
VRVTKAPRAAAGAAARRHRRLPTTRPGRIPGTDSTAAEDPATAAAEEATGEDVVPVGVEISQYIATAYTCVDVSDIINQRKMVKIAEPADLTDEEKKSETKVEIWKKMCGQYATRIYKRDENLKTAYLLILGQCSDPIKTKLEATPTWAAINASKDVLGLLSAIEALMFTNETGQDPTCALIEAQKRLMSMRQDPLWTTQDYFDRFKTLVRVV